MLQRRRILKTYLRTVNNINEIFVLTAQKIAFCRFYAYFVVNVVKRMVNKYTSFIKCLRKTFLKIQVLQ